MVVNEQKLTLCLHRNQLLFLGHDPLGAFTLAPPWLAKVSSDKETLGIYLLEESHFLSLCLQFLNRVDSDAEEKIQLGMQVICCVPCNDLFLPFMHSDSFNAGVGVSTCPAFVLCLLCNCCRSPICSDRPMS